MKLLKSLPPEPHRLSYLIYIATFVLCMPALWAGYMGDDYIHYALLSPNSPIVKPHDLSVFGLFSFINGDPERNRLLRDYSLIPWWTIDELKYAFWRPLTELSHWLDHTFWPAHPRLMHLHNLIWYLLVLGLLSKLFQSRTHTPVAALLGLAIYAFDSSHGFAIGWIANRNALLALFFSLISLLMYCRWREESGFKWLALSLFGLLLGLLSAESAVSVFGYIGAYALFLDKKGIVRGILATLPYLLTIVIWWLIYKDAGFGAANANAYYVDPVNHPVTFLGKVIERLPVLLASQWGIIPAEIYGFSGQTIFAYVMICLIFLIIILFPIMRLLKNNPINLFWFFGMLFSIFPVLTALPHDRLLFFTGIGASALLGNFFYKIYILKECQAANACNRYSRGVAHTLFAFHLILAPLLLPLMAYSTKIWADLIPTQPSYFDDVKDIKSKRIILFSPPIASAMLIGPLRFYRGEEMPDRIWTITTLDDGLHFSQSDSHTLEITREQGFLQGPEEEAFRDFQTYPIKEGETTVLSGLRIEMSDLNDAGKPTKMALIFDRSISDPSLVFLKWNRDQHHYDPLSFTKKLD